jgi:hypothetical protein
MATSKVENPTQVSSCWLKFVHASGKFQSYSQILKSAPGTNAPAYFAGSPVTAKNSFQILTTERHFRVRRRRRRRQKISRQHRRRRRLVVRRKRFRRHHSQFRQKTKQHEEDERTESFGACHRHHLQLPGLGRGRLPSTIKSSNCGYRPGLIV